MQLQEINCKEARGISKIHRNRQIDPNCDFETVNLGSRGLPKI